MSISLHRRHFIIGIVVAGLSGPRFLHAASNNQWGDLVGRLIFDGQPPERKRLVVEKAAQKYDIRDESLMVDSRGGLANVYLYLHSRKKPICPELVESVPKQVVLDNRDYIFKPHCMKIWSDRQEFLIINSDPVAQNVAYSPIGDAPANIVLPVGAHAIWRFQRKQNIPIPIACNYHPWEIAYILPRDNPYVDISAADGTFKITKLPVGKLEFQAWHERSSLLNTSDWTQGRFEVTIKPGVNDLGVIKLAPSLFEKNKKS
jgi:hypothetical protein